MNCSHSNASPSSRHLSTPSDDIRRRALERLYERRETILDLIGTLERYQEGQRQKLAPCVDISAGRKLQCEIGTRAATFKLCHAKRFAADDDNPAGH